MSIDVLLLSLGTTRGWRVADELFLAQLERAGASVAAVGVRFGGAGRLRRGYPVNDLVEMHAARRALRGALREHRPRALVVSTTTAAMLLPGLELPYAVRLDAPAALNRPGARNASLRALERRALRRARLVLPWSQAARAALPADAAPAVVLPPPVEPSGAAPNALSAPPRERRAISYVPDPKAKGLELVVAGWAAAGVEDARLTIYGLDPQWGRSHLERVGQPAPRSVEWAGMTTPAEFRAALQRVRVYVGGARWEDFGQAPLEALADGALLATVPSGGPFAALDLARQLDPRLVAPSLDGAALAEPLRTAFALDEPALASYRERAAALLAPFAPEAVQETVERDVLPALLR
jgi:hypothetical protein